MIPSFLWNLQLARRLLLLFFATAAAGLLPTVYLLELFEMLVFSVTVRDRV